jgi:lipopolysaccharide assembly outer membrane protein LptD (OstA)
MIKPRFLFLIALCLLAILPDAQRINAQEIAQETNLPTLEVISLGREGDFDEAKGQFTLTNGVMVRYTEVSSLTILTAERASINETTGDIEAQGHVRIQHDDATWVGEELGYNYLNHQVKASNFRMGQTTVFVGGDAFKGVGEGTNGLYRGTNAIITTDDYQNPSQKVRAHSFTMLPGKYVEARNAVLYVGSVPVFYFPYYRHSLRKNPNHFTFLPGYRSIYGPYLLSAYDWYYDDHFNGAIHFDERLERGLGVGPDVNYNFGIYGEGTARYYYARDHKPGTNGIPGTPIPRDRDRAYFQYNGSPLTNLTILSQMGYQKDPYVVRDFFEGQYNKDIQPGTFVDVNQFWRNWSLDAIAQPRVNSFWDTVERLPEVRLTGFRQQLGNTPFYYESQSGIGYFRRLFSDTNTVGGRDYSAARADTFHQVTMPENFFGWLNVTPRVGGRFTYYDSASGPGAAATNHSREVFNTGAEVSTTVSRVWSGAKNRFFDVDGLRHILQPSVNYVYVPRPNVLPGQLPQFDYQLTNNLRLLPLEYPDFNSIDSINSQNTIRYGIDNRLQTKRLGEMQDLVNWGVYMDWNLRPRTDQSTLSDIYSDLSMRPRSWLLLGSQTRYNISQSQFNLAQHSITLQPNNVWNWTVSHTYLRAGNIFGTGDNLFSSLYFYRLNENWAVRMAHYFDANTSRLQEQDYTFYRDMRSWTAGLTFRALSNVGSATDYGVAFTFSFKSFPRYTLGSDTVRAAPLVGN